MPSPQNIPTHVALIPDGNRRWAKARNLLPWEGHREGFLRFKEIVPEAFKLGITYLTVWAASEDNLTKRSPVEVRFLVAIIRQTIKDKELREELFAAQASLRVVGRYKQIIKDKRLIADIEKLQKETAHFKEKTLTILLAYDGRREMLEGIKKIGRQKSPLTYDTIHQSLWNAPLPPVDLIVRTAGEPHWSAGFMMWHAANAQLDFTPTLWPDFGAKKLRQVIARYARRERRMGK